MFPHGAFGCNSVAEVFVARFDERRYSKIAVGKGSRMSDIGRRPARGPLWAIVNHLSKTVMAERLRKRSSTLSGNLFLYSTRTFAYSLRAAHSIGRSRLHRASLKVRLVSLRRQNLAWAPASS